MAIGLNIFIIKFRYGKDLLVYLRINKGNIWKNLKLRKLVVKHGTVSMFLLV